MQLHTETHTHKRLDAVVLNFTWQESFSPFAHCLSKHLTHTVSPSEKHPRSHTITSTSFPSFPRTNRPHNYSHYSFHIPADCMWNTTFTELHLKAQFHISFCVTYKRVRMLPATLNGSLRGFSLCQQQEGQRGEGSGSPSSTAQPIISR